MLVCVWTVYLRWIFGELVIEVLITTQGIPKPTQASTRETGAVTQSTPKIKQLLDQNVNLSNVDQVTSNAHLSEKESSSCTFSKEGKMIRTRLKKKEGRSPGRKEEHKESGSRIVNWISGRWKINNQKFRKEIQKLQNMLNKMDSRPMANHLDIFHHVYREWNQEADRLTHVAREKGCTWNSYAKEEGEKIKAVWSLFDGGVSLQVDSSVKKKKWDQLMSFKWQKN